MAHNLWQAARPSSHLTRNTKLRSYLIDSIKDIHPWILMTRLFRAKMISLEVHSFLMVNPTPTAASMILFHNNLKCRRLIWKKWVTSYCQSKIRFLYRRSKESIWLIYAPRTIPIAISTKNALKMWFLSIVTLINSYIDQ